MYPLCPKCGTQTRPATEEEKAVYRGLDEMFGLKAPLDSRPDMIAWQCPECGEGGVRPIK